MTRTLLAAVVAALALGGGGCCCTEMHTFRGGCEAPVGCNTCTGNRPMIAHGGCSSCDIGCGSSCGSFGCGGCNPCGGCGFGHGPIGTLVHGIFSGIGNAMKSANGGCGDVYWNEWHSDPHTCNNCEPCHGHLLGRGNPGVIHGGAPMMSPGKPGCTSCGMSSNISTMPGSAAVVRVQQGPVMRNNQVMVQGAIASTPAGGSQQGPSVELPPGAIFISEQVISGPGANTTTSNVPATVTARPVQGQSVQAQAVQVQAVQPQKAGTVYVKPASAVQPSAVYGARPQYYTRQWPAN